jgi:transcriptional regulator with XRE-family HTH domain
VPSTPSSVQAAKQALGDRLREIRVGAGLTGRELAIKAGWHRTKVSKIEHGRTMPTPADIRTWCEHTNAAHYLADLTASLQAVEGMFIEWQRLERAGLRRAQEAATPLFEQAKRLRGYDSWLVPGLFQTPAYAKAILSATATRRGLALDDIDQAVALRMQRQHVLYDGGHRCVVLIEEAVLRNGIGGADTMAEQLGHLLTIGSLPSVALGIVPFAPGRELRPVEGFWIFDDVRVNVELVSGWLTLTQPTEIALYTQAFGILTAQAVYGAKAKALITVAMEALDRPTEAKDS